MKMSAGDKITIVAIGVAGLGLVHAAFGEQGGLIGGLGLLPQYVCDSLSTLIAWDAFPVAAIVLGMFAFVLLTLRK